MFLNVHHDVLKIECRDKPGPRDVFHSEGFQRALLMKVMEKLRKFCIVDRSLSVLAKVELYEWTVQFERDFSVQICLFENIDKLTVRHRTVTISIEQLESGFVQSVWCAEKTFKRLEFSKRDQSIFTGISDTGQQRYGILQ